MARVYSFLVSLLVVLMSSTMVWAQESWPTYSLDGFNVPRGSGSYLSWWKLLLVGLVFWIWVKTTDWVNQDAQILQLKHTTWNPANFFPFFGVFFLLTLNFPFPIGFSALVIAWLVPLLMYVFHRNANVEEYQKVLTPDHIRHLMSSSTGVKAEKRSARATAFAEFP